MQVIVQKLPTYYEDEGKGPVILLLHGWGDSSAGLQLLRKFLVEDYRVITPDLPGFGKTSAPLEPWKLDDYSSFLCALLKKIGISDIKAIVGHSNGGAIAIHGLSNGNLIAEKLVLLASAGIRGEAQGYQRSLWAITKVGKVGSRILPKHVRQNLRRKLYSRVGSDLLYAEHLSDTFKLIVADDVRKDAANLQVPTLLVYGQNDTATPPRFGELLNRAIKGSQLVIIPEAGHFVHLDAGAALQEQIERFLQ